MTSLELAAEALRDHHKTLNGSGPTKKYVQLRETLIKAALEPNREKKKSSGPLNPESPCCGAETVWVMEEGDACVVCGACLAYMDFNAINSAEYEKRLRKKKGGK